MDFSKLRSLLEQGASQAVIAYLKQQEDHLCEFDDNGLTALFHVLSSKHAFTAIKLFKAYPILIDNIVAQKIQATPLLIAAEDGHSDIVNALLEAGAEKDKETLCGSTPLFRASENGHIDIVSALLDVGADKEKSMTDGATSLFIAAQGGHIDVVNVLLEAGADKEKSMTRGETPLYISAQNGHIDVVKVLLKAGADKDRASTLGATPLFIASQKGHSDVVKFLLASGADKEKVTPRGATALHLAAQQGHIDVVKALLAFGADITHKTNGKTPLLQASRYNRLEVVKLLAAPPSTTMEMLQTYLHDVHVQDETKAILQSEMESRLEMAGDDAKCQAALAFWPKCPISTDYIINPVRAADNHVYEETYIKEWLSRKQTSPMTNEKLASKVLEPDLTAKRTIDVAREIIDKFSKAQKMPAWKGEYDAIKQEILDKYSVHKPEEADAVAASSTHGRFFTEAKQEECEASAGPSSMLRQSKIETAH